MMIGSIPGIFIVIVSFPALKLGYNVILFVPESMMKSLVGLKMNCVLVPVAVVMIFFSIVHGFNNHCLLVMFATVFNGLCFCISLMLIVMLATLPGLICGIPSASIY